jgi:DNA-directed RNA polymerase subunit RPC12/RpoP
MKFQAFQCECGYNLVTAEDIPKCPDCGKKMVIMDQNTDRYKKFDHELKKLFG